MRNSLQNLKNFISSNIILVALAVVSLLFIIILFASLSSNRADDTTSRDTIDQTKSINTDAENLSQLNLPDDSQRAILDSIAKIAKNNGLQNSINASDVSIRAKTTKTKNFSDFNLNYINFVVDIPSAKQSYQVSHEWSGQSDNEYLSSDFSALVFCVRDESRVKYKSFSCEDPYTVDPKYEIIKNYARFDASDDLELIIHEGDPPTISATSFRLNEETDAELINKAQKWVQSLGFSVDDIPIRVTTAGGGAPEE